MARIKPFCWWMVLLLTAGAIVFGPADGQAQTRGKASRNARRPRDVSSFRKQLGERREKFSQELADLARVCDEKKLPEAAEKIRRLAEPVDTSELRLTALPRKTEPPLAADLSPDEHFWQAQLRSRQQEYARELYALSQQAASAGHVSFAIDLIREILLHDSDHAKARRILGYVRNGDEWVSAFESQMLRAKKVWTDRFGWLNRDYVERYEKGERYYNHRWMPAAKEAEIRSDFRFAWEIQTEHYLVRTNHSLERGVDLAKKLEDFHGLFFQMMAGFFNSAAEVQQLFAGGGGNPRTRKRNVVHFYNSRDEYIAVLKNETTQPIEITKGIYFPRSGIAYFFYDPETDNDSTLYHEATHQLLSGSRPMTGEIGVKSDFWIIEGIACYMESFHRDGDRYSVGDPAHERLQAARIHYVDENYYIPLRQFTRMGMTAYQAFKQKDLARNYSQGAALAHFFMHYDGGRYREALIEQLSQVYSPVKAVSEHPEPLEELIGIEDEELDRQYGQYIRQLVPVATKEAAPPATVGAEEP